MATSTKRMERQVEIPSGRRRLRGTLRVPPGAKGVVAFAHGSGSGRLSPRNQCVARALEEGGLATLLLDLLEEEEAEDRDKVFDIELLAYRLQNAADWLRDEHQTHDLPLGYLGASTGAAAALVAAARYPAPVHAVVSRGGRPDLARDDLPAVRAPTLLIVGGNDEEVLQLNEQALHLLHCPKKLVVIPTATHLFEEPGTLEEVARLAKEWFVRHLALVIDDRKNQPHNLSEIAPSVEQDLGSRFPKADMDQEC
jgi:putative phosphoribosyl transferase